MAVKDLSPKRKIPLASDELLVPPGTVLMGQRSGGLSMFSNVFKRGYGDAVFGSSALGIWLGAADFADATFSVDMDGNVIAASATFGQYLSKAGVAQVLTGDIQVKDSKVSIDGTNGRIVTNDGSNNRAVMGDA